MSSAICLWNVTGDGSHRKWRGSPEGDLVDCALQTLPLEAERMISEGTKCRTGEGNCVDWTDV